MILSGRKLVFRWLYELKELSPEQGIELPFPKKFWAESLDVTKGLQLTAALGGICVTLTRWGNKQCPGS